MNPETVRGEASGVAVDNNVVNDVLSWLQSTSSPYFACNIETISGQNPDNVDDCRDPGILCRRMIQQFIDNA